MILRFHATVQRVEQQQPHFSAVSAAGIDVIHLNERTKMIGADGGSVGREAIQPGVRIQISGIDEGGRHLQADRLVILSEGRAPDITRPYAALLAWLEFARHMLPAKQHRTGRRART